MAVKIGGQAATSHAAPATAPATAPMTVPTTNDDFFIMGVLLFFIFARALK